MPATARNSVGFVSLSPEGSREFRLRYLPPVARGKVVRGGVRVRFGDSLKKLRALSTMDSSKAIDLRARTSDGEFPLPPAPHLTKPTKGLGVRRMAGMRRPCWMVSVARSPGRGSASALPHRRYRTRERRRADYVCHPPSVERNFRGLETTCVDSGGGTHPSAGLRVRGVLVSVRNRGIMKRRIAAHADRQDRTETVPRPYRNFQCGLGVANHVAFPAYGWPNRPGGGSCVTNTPHERD